MTPATLSRRAITCCLLATFACLPARADDSAAQFQRAYYLQVHDRDYAAAAAALEKVVADSATPEKLRGEARARLAQCREDLASVDLARLMPADALAYVELNRPGEQISRLAKMLGLVQEPRAQPVIEADGGKVPGIPLGDGLFLPADFSLSPALLAELQKIRGAAIAITKLDQRMEMPDGILVIHPGDSDLLRGILETAVQLIEPVEPIAGFKTYRLRSGPRTVWLTVTARLLIAGTEQDAVAATVARLANPQAEGLPSRPAFRAFDERRRAGLLFAYVDGPAAAKQLAPLTKGQDGAMMRAILDPDHLESFVFVAGVTDDSVQVTAQLNLMPGHHNLAYNLIRTAPATRRSLGHVPRGAAAVAIVGLNPPLAASALNATSTADAPVEVTGMDLGRELFGNIEEVAFFAMPPTAGAGPSRSPLPEMAAVFAVKDAAKSEAVWNQILTLAAFAGVRDPDPRDITIEGQLGKRYQFPGMPPLLVLRCPERALLVGTEGAVTASVRAAGNHESILADDSFAKLLARLTPNSSKAVLVDAGRMMRTMRGASLGGSPAEMALVEAALADLRLSVVTDEAPNSLTLSVEATGLPNVPAIVRMLVRQSPAARGSK